MPPGIYTVRQHLNAHDPPQPNAPIRRFIQTAPLRNPQLANPLSSPYGQWNDQFNPIEYVLEWSGNRRKHQTHPLMPDGWQATDAGSHVSFSMAYAYDPSVQPEMDPQQQSVNFQSIEHYSWRLESGSAEAGVAEFATVDRSHHTRHGPARKSIGSVFCASAVRPRPTTGSRCVSPRPTSIRSGCLARVRSSILTVFV